ncbi:MAG: hypothetical protein WBP83_01910 [Nitrososphaeraceae archaeon]
MADFTHQLEATPPPQKAIEDTGFEFKKIKEFYKSIFSNVSHSIDYGQSQVRYYCMKCGNEHREITCPKCGSKMKKG